MLRAVLIDDSADLRALTRFTLELEADTEVIGEAADGAAGLDLIEELSPDVAVVDLHMPGVSGLDLIRRVKERGVSLTRLVAYSADDAALEVALGAGADAAVSKTGDLDNLLLVLLNPPGC